MADRIIYSVSATPIETVTQAVTYSNIEDTSNHANSTNNSHDVLATEVGKTLGGSGESVCNGYAATAAYQGYLNQTPNYRLTPDDGDTTDISAEASASFVYIKNTGKALATDNTAVLGDTLDKALKIMVGTTLISVLDPGEAIVLKDDNLGIACTGIHVRTVDLDGGDNSSAGHLAVEYLVVD